jgi:hypothetical protein
MMRFKLFPTVKLSLRVNLRLAHVSLKNHKRIMSHRIQVTTTMNFTVRKCAFCVGHVMRFYCRPAAFDIAVNPSLLQ